MLDTNPFFNSAPRFKTLGLVLSKTISAIQVGPDGRLRPISQLPGGAEVSVCGEGFNDRTVKVSWNQNFYFVFQEDLTPPEMGAMAAKAS